MTTPNPPQAATVEGHLKCLHSGSFALSDLGDPGTLTVGGKAVVLVPTMPATGTYDGCTATDSNGTVQQCNAATLTATGTVRLTVGSTPVLLTNAGVAVVNPFVPNSGQGTVDPGQTTLTVS